MEPQTGTKSRPRSLSFPLPHQRHLEPSRLSPQTPLSSAPGSHAKVSFFCDLHDCSWGFLFSVMLAETMCCFRMLDLASRML